MHSRRRHEMAMSLRQTSKARAGTTTDEGSADTAGKAWKLPRVELMRRRQCSSAPDCPHTDPISVEGRSGGATALEAAGFKQGSKRFRPYSLSAFEYALALQFGFALVHYIQQWSWFNAVTIPLKVLDERIIAWQNGELEAPSRRHASTASMLAAVFLQLAFRTVDLVTRGSTSGLNVTGCNPQDKQVPETYLRTQGGPGHLVDRSRAPPAPR